MSVRVWLGSPVDLAMKAVAPEHAVGGDIHADCDGVFLRGNDLRVVPLHQVNTPDLVSVREQQVRTFPCTQQTKRRQVCMLQVTFWIYIPSDLFLINVLFLFLHYCFYGSSSSSRG